MLENIKTLIEKDEYREADLQLKDIINKTDKNTELFSNATYLRGCIHTENKNQNKSDFIAKDSFLKCIDSEYPNPQAFYKYAELEEDNNIAVNYLKLGLEKFSKNEMLYRLLLKKTKLIQDKIKLIKQIEKLKIIDYYLFLDIIEIYIDNDNWEKCFLYSETILASYKLDNDENILFNLISAFSIIKSEGAKLLPEAKRKLLEIIQKDIRNDLNYASYMGLIWLYLINNDIEKVIEYFDRIPFNGLQDYDNQPWLIYINFEMIYSIIFDKLNQLFIKDKKRKQKAQILLAMYICQREYYWDNVNKIQKKHIIILKKAFKDYPKEVYLGKYLFVSQRKLKLHFEAYLTAISMYQSEETFLNHICFESILNDITDYDFMQITNNLCTIMPTIHVSKVFTNHIVDKIIVFLYQSEYVNKYKNICDIAEKLNNDNINDSTCKFEIAYSYEELNNHKKAEKIYKLELKSRPNSSAVLNNLGVIYKNNKEYEKAIQYFTKGLKADPNSEKCPINLEETKKKLQEQNNKKYKMLANNLSIEFFESIGYNEELKILFDKITNTELKELLLKDIEECTICIATNQNKSAIILCGSIVEAILMDCILNKSITKYKIKDNNKSVKDMSLNELLIVAEKEGMISKTTYSLSHVIKDYRNIIHPSNLLRNSFKISNERVMVIWNILKEIIESLLV